ncbi:MAG: DUF397 domain-containing protein [Sciscionella sp.]
MTLPQHWRKSSFSSSQTNCVEVAPLDDGGVMVRDTKDRNLQAHRYTHDEWVAFVAGVKAGEFDF